MFEDDHNMGWGLQNLTHAVFGAHGAEGGAGSIYRFYLPDLYVFESTVRQRESALFHKVAPIAVRQELSRRSWKDNGWRSDAA